MERNYVISVERERKDKKKKEQSKARKFVSSPELSGTKIKRSEENINLYNKYNCSNTAKNDKGKYIIKTSSNCGFIVYNF